MPKPRPPAKHPVLKGITERSFLTGPDPDEERELDVDTIFGKPWARVLSEMIACDPGCLDPDPNGVETPSDLRPGYAFRPVAAGLLLVAPGGSLAGGYLSCDVSVDEAHQGLGLGAELIAEHFLRSGDTPTWSLDTAAYSPAGEAAHRAAYRLMRARPELVDKKLSRFEIPNPHPAAAPGPRGPR